MATPDKHYDYTSADLMRYAKGKMSSGDMHALEKAALDDSFLAEALEGYVIASEEGSSADDIDHRLNQLKDSIGKQKTGKKRPAFLMASASRWIWYAAAACLLTGIIWYATIISRNREDSSEPPIAQNQESPKQEDTQAAKIPTPGSSTAPQSDSGSSNTRAQTGVNGERVKINAGPGRVQQVDLVPPLLARAKEEFRDSNSRNYLYAADSVFVQKEATDLAVSQKTIESKNAVATAPRAQNKPLNNQEAAAATPRYFFNGKIVDENNNPLPYSNIMIPEENMGTYSDGKGNFNFIYTDSILPVRVKSLGYLPQSFVMYPDNRENKLVLKEDQELKNKITVSRQEKQGKQPGYRPLIIEEDSLLAAEPSVGWYDFNMYALNNVRLADLPVTTRMVKLSFEVGKFGDVQHIVVEKSSGKALDEEAIRLLKEGPKWKAKAGTKGRSVLTLKF